MTDFSKLDTPLALAVHSAQAENDLKDTRLSVLVKFEGAGDQLAESGLEVFTQGKGFATGIISLADVSALTLQHWILYISTGTEPTIDLEDAARDVNARATDTTLADGLWHADETTGAFTSSLDQTGSGVIVAIIDTGIDYSHPMFLSRVAPTFKSRILRIWDMGLTPAVESDAPDKNLLVSNRTYGVEYKTTDIELALDNGIPLAHSDCVGHGTHCAGIAAGGPVFAAGGDAKLVGVAPEADIVAVKLLDLPDEVKYFGAPAADVSHDIRFKDAIMYCLRFAKQETKPVVLSMSFGSSYEPGDGLDDDAIWLDDVLDPGATASDNQFPSGAIAVRSVGNDGRTANKNMARIVVPANGEIVVPIMMEDNRRGEEFLRQECVNKFYAPPIFNKFWYKRASPFTAVEFSVKVPERPFTGAMGVGGFQHDTYVDRAGSPREVIPIGFSEKHLRVFAKHNGEPAVAHPSGGTVRRHSFDLLCFPRSVGQTSTYLTGLYEVKIQAPAGTEVFLRCGWAFWNGRHHDGSGKFVRMLINDVDSAGVLTSTKTIFMEKEHTAVDTLGVNAITVGSYDERSQVLDSGTNSLVPNSARHHVSEFSSWGPLRFFGDPALGQSQIAIKPDIGAPGEDLSSAQSVHSGVALPQTPAWHRGNRFVPKGGTSMAAPMVAGAIATLLDKDGSLNTTQVRDHLIQSVRPAVEPANLPSREHAYGSGLLDVKSARDRLP